MKDRIVTRSPRLAKVSSHAEPQGPVLVTQQVGSESRRAATPRPATEEISAIVDADHGQSTCEVETAARIPWLVDDTASQQNIQRWLIHVGFLSSSCNLHIRKAEQE
jgi:hypothetical protein